MLRAFSPAAAAHFHENSRNAFFAVVPVEHIFTPAPPPLIALLSGLSAPRFTERRTSGAPPNAGRRPLRLLRGAAGGSGPVRRAAASLPAGR